MRRCSPRACSGCPRSSSVNCFARDSSYVSWCCGESFRDRSSSVRRHVGVGACPTLVRSSFSRRLALNRIPGPASSSRWRSVARGRSVGRCPGVIRESHADSSSGNPGCCSWVMKPGLAVSMPALMCPGATEPCRLAECSDAQPMVLQGSPWTAGHGSECGQVSNLWGSQGYPPRSIMACIEGTNLATTRWMLLWITVWKS